MKRVFALALALAVMAPAFARTIHQNHNTRRGLRAYDYTTQAPANPSPDTMRWGADQAGGGSVGYTQHNEVKN